MYYWFFIGAIVISRVIQLDIIEYKFDLSCI
jgi:hypothetical protein